MPAIQLTPGHLARPRLGLPAIPAVNCILEKTPGGPSPDVRTSRPGLFSVYNIGTGPIFFDRKLPLLDEAFGVSATIVDPRPEWRRRAAVHRVGPGRPVGLDVPHDEALVVGDGLLPGRSLLALDPSHLSLPAGPIA